MNRSNLAINVQCFFYRCVEILIRFVGCEVLQSATDIWQKQIRDWIKRF